MWLLSCILQFIYFQCFSDVANWQRANVWSLIQDNEYVLSKLHASLDVFPTLMGTCGGLYVVEALEPLSYPHYLAKLSFGQWAQRVSVALGNIHILRNHLGRGEGYMLKDLCRALVRILELRVLKYTCLKKRFG